MRHRGIFIVAELTGAVADRIRAIQQESDPRLAASQPPHLTLVGSSGAGPISGSTTEARLRELLEPVAARTPPMTLHFERPHRFMQTEIVVLPLDPHGPLRTLHEEITSSGLDFATRARFTFSPHVTLNLYRTLTPERLRALMAVRIDEPFTLERFQVYQSMMPQPPRKILELRLTGAPREMTPG